MRDIRITPMDHRKKMADKYRDYLLQFTDETNARSFKRRYDAEIAFFDEAPWLEIRTTESSCVESIQNNWKPDLLVVPTRSVFLDMVCCGYLTPERFDNVVVIYTEKEDGLPITLMQATNLVYDWRRDGRITVIDGVYHVPAPDDQVAKVMRHILEYAESNLRVTFCTEMTEIPWFVSLQPIYVLSCLDAICHNESFKEAIDDMSYDPACSYLLSLPRPEYEPTVLRFYFDRSEMNASVLSALLEKMVKASLWFNFMQYENRTLDVPALYFDALERYGKVSYATNTTGNRIRTWLEENCIGGIAYGALEAAKSIQFTDAMNTAIESVKDDHIWK